MAQQRTAREILTAWYPGATILQEVKDSHGRDIVSFEYTPDCQLTGLLRSRLAEEIALWPVCEKHDPQEPNLPPQGWGAYVDDTAAFDPAQPFPRGLGVMREGEKGFEFKVLVVSHRDAVRAIEPSLPEQVEDFGVWAMGLPDPDELNPDEAVDLLAHEVRKYCGTHGHDQVHVVTSVQTALQLDRVLGCTVEIKTPTLNYNGNEVTVVAIETIKAK